MLRIERLSVELTNLCRKGCWFCYNHSHQAGKTSWQVDELVAMVADCAANGVAAVSFGGGEPLEFKGLFDLLRQTDGMIFRSLTTNGLLFEQHLDALMDSRPDKIHVSIHFPGSQREVERVLMQVNALHDAGIRSGVNLLVRRGEVEAATVAASRLREAGIQNDRIVYLPMRGRDTPTPAEVSRAAGDEPFQSMSCLSGCAASPRFCSLDWDKQVAWCSYTQSRRRIACSDYHGIVNALADLPLLFCGGTDESAA